jgi:C1A family cysteine protease
MKRKIILLITAIISLSLFCGPLLLSFADEKIKDNDPHKMGLVFPTKEEHAKFKKNHRRVKRILPNRLGLERINTHRKKMAMPQLGEENIAKEGEDVISAIEPNAPVSSAPQEAQGLLVGGSLPNYVDNSQLPSFPQIRSQGALGSCASFSMVYYQMTHNVGLQMGWDNRYSDNYTKFSPKWAYNMLNNGADSGSWFPYDLLEKHGAATWAEFPYDTNYREWCLNPTVWRNAISFRTQPVQWIPYVNTDSGLQQMKEILNNGYVLVYATYVNSWQRTIIKDDPATNDDNSFVGKGVYYWVNGYDGGHGMTVVGYNDAIWVDINNNGVVDPGEKGALKIANSWGTTWEDGGFTWLAYDALRSPSAVSGGPNTGRVKAFWDDMAYLITPRVNYTPKLLAEFTVNHLKRNQLEMSLGVSETSQTLPSTIWVPEAISYQGGAYAFNGTTTAVSGTFVFDFTDILPQGSTQKRYYLGMKDTALGDSATLSSFKIIDLYNYTETPATGLPKTADNNQVYSYVDYTFTDYNSAPVAVISAAPTSGYIPLEVTFSGSDSYDSDGIIVAYEWDFGDGTNATGMTVQHTFLTVGTYYATLMVRDDKGAYSYNYVEISANSQASILINHGAEYANSRLVTLNISVMNATNFSEMQFSNDGVVWLTPEPFATVKDWTLSDGDGTKTVYTKIKDNGGNWSESFNDTIFLDSTAPSTPTVQDSGKYTKYNTELSATWACEDLESGIMESQYAIGTTPGATDVVSWTYAGANNYIYQWGLNLVNGSTYYFSLKVQNGAGLWSAVGYSDGITVNTAMNDTTPPVTPVVNDEGQFTGSSSSLTANWSSFDLDSDISEYQYAIGTSKGGTNIMPWTSAGTSTTMTLDSLALMNSYTYYFSVKAKNGADLWSAVGYSDGIRVDLTKPNKPTVKDEGIATSSTSSLYASWSTTDSISGVAEYQYQILEGSTTGTIIRDWTSAGTNTSVTADGLSLMQNKKYFFGVKAKDKVGLISDVGYSDGILVDTTPPTLPTATDAGAFTNSTSSLYCKWSSSDLESGIQEYLYAIGTSKGATDTLPWTSASTSTSVTKTGLALSHGRTYYFSVKVKNKAGLISDIAYSDGITIDTNLPTSTISSLPTGWQTATVTVTFSATDDLSGVGKIYYSTNGSTPTSVYALPLSLKDGIYTIKYYSQDIAGNKEAINTAPTQLTIDTTAPTTPAVKDEGAVTGSALYLYASWASGEATSGIVEYQYKITQDSTTGLVIRDWTSVGTATSIVADGLTLTNGKKYYFGVKAKNGAGLTSNTGYTDGIVVNTGAP